MAETGLFLKGHGWLQSCGRAEFVVCVVVVVVAASRLVCDIGELPANLKSWFLDAFDVDSLFELFVPLLFREPFGCKRLEVDGTSIRTWKCEDGRNVYLQLFGTLQRPSAHGEGRCCNLHVMSLACAKASGKPPPESKHRIE